MHLRGISPNLLKKVSDKMAKLYDKIFILFTQEEADKIKKGLPVLLYDEETGKQIVFMTEEGYKEMNDWWNASPN